MVDEPEDKSFLPKPANGQDRRVNARAPVNMFCELDLPGLPFLFKARIMDLSAGGMRLKIPKISEEHLSSPFYVQWPMGGSTVRAKVYRLYNFTEHEIAVRFLPSGDTLTSEITRYVYIILKTRSQGGKLYDLPEPADEHTPVARRERRLKLMRNNAMSLQDAAVKATDRHKSSLSKWLDRRVVSHLESD